jgi:hypothetical protein
MRRRERMFYLVIAVILIWLVISLREAARGNY